MRRTLDLFSVNQQGKRGPRLEHLFLEELGRLFRMEVRDAELQKVVPVFITMSKDFRSAKVIYIMNEETSLTPKALVERLEKVTPFLRSSLANTISMKRAPELYFTRDKEAESAKRVQAILEQEQAKESK